MIRECDNPDLYADDAEAYARYRSLWEKMDSGELCPTCGATEISTGQALGLDLFHCERCATDWFDLVTRPAQ